MHGQIILKQFLKKNKVISKEKKKCVTILTFIEILFLFTENKSADKNIASFYLISQFLNNKECKGKQFIIKETKRIYELFLNNKHIEMDVKKRIIKYLKEIGSN